MVLYESNFAQGWALNRLFFLQSHIRFRTAVVMGGECLPEKNHIRYIENINSLSVFQTEYPRSCLGIFSPFKRYFPTIL